MKLGRSIVALVLTACVVLAALAVFATELSHSQNRSRRDVETQIRDRAVLAASLINSVFSSAVQAPPDPVYSQATVTAGELDGVAHGSGIAYVAVLDRSGAVLARSSGLTAAQASALATSPEVKAVASGQPYGLGNLVPFGQGAVIDLAAPVHTTFGTRTVVTGLTAGSGPSTIGRFLTTDLRSIPGVAGEINYVVDGNDKVLASTSTRFRVDAPIAQPGAVAALSGAPPNQRDTYFAHVALRGSGWNIVLAAPDERLFASLAGTNQFVPWVIFAAFALAALIALLLGWRAVLTAHQLQDANRRLAGVNRDLSHANTALERRASELARSNEELDQFASIASHDLQEPLRKVRTFTEQLKVMEADLLSERGRDYLERANSAAERMQNLIEDLLRFSRVSTQGRPFVAVDLGETTRAVLLDLESQISETGARVRVGVLPVIQADPLQMHQLMQNLVSNALKFRKEGVPPEIDVEASTDGAMATVTVSDNGIGFDQRYAQRIFRIFERLHGRSEYPGTGIGLALCRKIADRHGGTVAADGETDQGAVFTVTLPLSQTVRHEPTTAGDADPGPDRPPAREGTDADTAGTGGRAAAGLGGGRR